MPVLFMIRLRALKQQMNIHSYSVQAILRTLEPLAEKI